jgi:hypothetical protein
VGEERLMSIASVNSIGQTPSADTDSSASGPSSPASSVKPVSAVTDEYSQASKPPRFPWLSRLSEQLEAASQQPSPFAAAPVLGDNVDKAA